MNDLQREVGASRARALAAIDRAIEVLWSEQRADGSWDARSDVGPASTANVVVALHHAGAPIDRAASARWLRSRQRDDGSFVAYPGAARGDLSVTAQCWAALHLDAESADAAAKAEAYVRAHGGLPALLDRMGTGDTAPIWLALAGLAPPRDLPRPSMLWALSDTAVRFVAGRVHFGFVMGALQLSLIARHLRGGSRSWLERREAARALDLLSLYQNADGSWNANTVQTAMALPALIAAGLSKDDPRVVRAAQWLASRRVEDEDGAWYDVFSSDVWTTAFDVRALLAAGASPSDPRLARALSWLLDRQIAIPQPWPSNRRAGALRTGGWPFQTGNETMADCDDAAVVLSAIGLATEGSPPERARADEASRAGLAWLSGMQNPDGGWGAFVWDLPGRRPARTLFTKPIDLPPNDPLRALLTLLHPPPELGDPSTEDLTGRVLHALGAHGCTTAAPEVARAIAFLRAHQTDSGAWWGRWVCNYLASTAYVLSGLAGVGQDLSEPWVERAIAFLLAHQNDDGGFGESIASYADPERAGRGPSTPPLTALVLTALVDVGRVGDAAAQRAAEYLLREQRSDGTWPNGAYLVTNIPPDGFYAYEGAARYGPLEALARYVRG